MHPLSWFTLIFLSSFLSSVISIQCSKTQYSWPANEDKLCCEKCPPGKRMRVRKPDSCVIDCVPCAKDQYTNDHNVETSCDVCENCNKQNMEYESYCNTTHNAVCRCKPGYTCTDQQCTWCTPVLTTTTRKATTPPLTTVFKKDTLPTFCILTGTTALEPVTDNTTWFLVITALLCAGIALILVTKLKSFLRWIRSKHGYFLPEKTVPGSPHTEEENVSTPIQEMCGKCDQPINISGKWNHVLAAVLTNTKRKMYVWGLMWRENICNI
ncbi:CD27 antigen [Thalassophryne amazonica]|uniref:CD27 antigen n=1 Tax=Thalassophryne amazonica TaxID=390379 RepID=UPI001470F843|nr:CD27 antigen [Thalassophryne amazonica]